MRYLRKFNESSDEEYYHEIHGEFKWRCIFF